MERQNWKPGNMLYPVPAVMVVCARPNQKPNIITIAWAGTICTNPAMLSISIRPGRYSYDIIKETGEFTVNLVTPALAQAADYCGVRSGRQVDKFAATNLDPIASAKIQAPGIRQSPVILECKLKQTLALGSHHMFLAEVVNVSVAQEQIDDHGKFHLNRLGLVAYSHGQYFSLGEKLGRFGYSVQKQASPASGLNSAQAKPGRPEKNKDRSSRPKGQGQQKPAVTSKGSSRAKGNKGK